MPDLKFESWIDYCKSLSLGVINRIGHFRLSFFVNYSLLSSLMNFDLKFWLLSGNTGNVALGNTWTLAETSQNDQVLSIWYHQVTVTLVLRFNVIIKTTCPLINKCCFWATLGGAENFLKRNEMATDLQTYEHYLMSK